MVVTTARLSFVKNPTKPILLASRNCVSKETFDTIALPEYANANIARSPHTPNAVFFPCHEGAISYRPDVDDSPGFMMIGVFMCSGKMTILEFGLSYNLYCR